MCVPISIIYIDRIEKKRAFWGKRRMSLVGRAKKIHTVVVRQT